MTDVNKRMALFFFICVPVRLLLAYMIYHAKPKYLKYIGYVTTVIAGLFILSYINFNPVKVNKGAFGGKIWWNDMRAIHGCIYLLFSLFAIKKYINSWKILIVDVIVGITAFLFQYKKFFY